MENITDLNISEKIESMKKLMQIWVSRNVTPQGRITIFKSLIISKITYLLQALPSPSKEQLKHLAVDGAPDTKRL